MPDLNGSAAPDWLTARPSSDEYSPPEWVNANVGSQEEDGDFKKGLMSGYENLKAAGHGASALLGGALGNEDWEASALEDYQAATERAGKHQGRITHIDQIESVGDAVDFIQFYGANGLVSTIPTLAGGGVGAIAGKKALTNYIENKVKEEVSKGVAEKTALKAVGASVAKKGAAVGALGASDTQLSGLTFGNIYDETGEIERGKSLISGTAQAGLEIIPGMAVLKKMGLGKVAQEGIQEVADGLIKSTGKIAGQEALTEGAQNIIETATLKWVDDNRDILGEEGYKGVLNAMAAGAAGGATMGAPAHLVGGGPIRGQKLTPEQVAQNKAKLQSLMAARAEAKAKAAADATGGDALTRANAETKSLTEDDPLIIALGKTLPGDLNKYPGDTQQYLETPPPQRFDPILEEKDVKQRTAGEQPTMPERGASKGIDGLISVAEKMGFSEESSRLRIAQTLYKRAAETSNSGNLELAGRMANRANAIRNDILKKPEIEREFANQYPAEYTFIADSIEGGDLATTNNPNFTMPESDINGEYQRVQPKQLEDGSTVYTGQGQSEGTPSAIKDPIEAQKAPEPEQAQVSPEEAALELAREEREVVERELRALEEEYPEARIDTAPSKMEREIDEYYRDRESTQAEQLPVERGVEQAGSEAQETYQEAGIAHTQDQTEEGLTLATEADGIKAEKPSPKAAKAADDKAQIDREREFFGLEQQNNQPKSEGKQEGLELGAAIPPSIEKTKKKTPLSEIIVVSEDGKKQSAKNALAESTKRLDALYALKACINEG